MLICCYCQQETSNEENFCEHCYKQLKCLSADCGNLLKPNKPICLKCGRIVVATTTNQAAPNIYEEHIKQTADGYEHDRRIQATDMAVEKFFAPLVGKVQPPQMRQQFPVAPRNGEHPVAPPPLMPLLAEATIEATTPEIEEQPIEATATTRVQQNSTFYEVGSEKEIKLLVADFGGKNMREQQERFILLHTYAHQEATKEDSSKNLLFKSAKEHSLYDSNFSKYYARHVQAKNLVGSDTAFHLTTSGNMLVKDILANIENSEKGFEYWKQGAPDRSVPADSHDSLV